MRIRLITALLSGVWATTMGSGGEARGGDLQVGVYPIRRVEFRNEGEFPVGAVSLSLLDHKGVPKHDPDPKEPSQWLLVDADEIGYGPRVPSPWSDGTGYASGTTMLADDGCDAHRTFLPKFKVPQTAKGVFGASVLVWVEGENRFATFCATSAGVIVPIQGAYKIPAGARELAGVQIAYRGICWHCCRAVHHYAVRTHHYSQCGGETTKDWRFQIEAELPKRRGALGQSRGAASPVLPLAPAPGGDVRPVDGPGAPKPFHDFELRNGGNRKINSAKVKGHRKSTSATPVAFENLFLADAGVQQLGSEIQCNGAGQADPPGHETGPALENDAEQPCRRQFPGSYANVTALVYTISIQFDDDTVHTVELCVSSMVPADNCPSSNDCVNDDTCPDNQQEFPLANAVVEYLGYADDVHKFKVTRGVYRGGASDMTVTTEEKCCAYDP